MLGPKFTRAIIELNRLGAGERAIVRILGITDYSFRQVKKEHKLPVHKWYKDGLWEENHREDVARIYKELY